MADESNSVIAYNGEIYNHPEVRRQLSGDNFRTSCDTEVVLRALRNWGLDALDHLRGMFAFAWWDEQSGELLCARDRFGIKPLYYAEVDGVLYVASEAKALMPFLPAINTDVEGLGDYLAFQFCLGGKTLFEGVRELLPAHALRVRNGVVSAERYWDVQYERDWDHTDLWFKERMSELLAESVDLHLRSDVPVSAYLSGGLDSSTVAALAAASQGAGMAAFTGRFEGAAYDESPYAKLVAEQSNLDLELVDIGVDDFVGSIENIIYHLDYPTAGPGSFPQFMVSRAAARSRKVILGGQGGDEIFGGYTRYLIAYFEQCIKAAIEGTSGDGSYVVTYESIIPSLESLRGYKPLLQEFWRDGLFEDIDARYFRLINRSRNLGSEIRPGVLSGYDPFESFVDIFNGGNVDHRSYFDKMTHFDFKTLLPALLQIEDRVSMAHGLESRVPLLDHRIVELAATVPADIKFRNGEMKHLFREVATGTIPDEVVRRKDKMGFPVPLTDWIAGPAREFVTDVFSSPEALSRELFDNRQVLDQMSAEGQFGRQTWGMLSLELWQRQYHDRAADFRGMLTKEGVKL
jgi:asparagine synthase (glutamine-hydrolysing)